MATPASATACLLYFDDEHDAAQRFGAWACAWSRRALSPWSSPIARTSSAARTLPATPCASGLGIHRLNRARSAKNAKAAAR